ncbi:MAG: hypothetical protein HY047_16475, partial [Acidobacteria bacterium]|nr:hypothetical protein [Acidobacteriota bacterium]
MLHVVTSTSAASRLDAAKRFLAGRPPASELVIVGASRGAADDLARAIARGAGATFGLHRFSLTEVAARAAASAINAGRRAPGSQAGAEAIAARAVFDALAAADLEYFAPVASMPGFPKALARTLHELRLAGISSDRLTSQAGPEGPALQMESRSGPFGPGGATGSRPGPFGPGAASGSALHDIGQLLARFEAQLDRAAVDDRAALFHLAAGACRDGRVRWAALPIVLLDVPLDSRAEQEFVAALIDRSPDVLATVPSGDHFALNALAAMSGTVGERPDGARRDSDLAHLRRFVFDKARP